MVAPAATALLSDISLTVSKVQDPIPDVALVAKKIEEAFAVKATPTLGINSRFTLPPDRVALYVPNPAIFSPVLFWISPYSIAFTFVPSWITVTSLPKNSWLGASSWTIKWPDLNATGIFAIVVVAPIPPLTS